MSYQVTVEKDFFIQKYIPYYTNPKIAFILS